jgi:hypothetical protein
LDEWKEHGERVSAPPLTSAVAVVVAGRDSARVDRPLLASRAWPTKYLIAGRKRKFVIVVGERADRIGGLREQPPADAGTSAATRELRALRGADGRR